jgi:acid phosphatase type 7
VSPFQAKLNKSIFAAALAYLLSGCAMDSASTVHAAQDVRLTDKGVAIYAAGDIADCKNLEPAFSGAAKTAALIAERLVGDNEALVFALGDNTYPIGLPIEFSNCYEPTWGRFKARTRPAPGNHDYYTPQAIGYYGYFGEAAGPERRGYYSFDVGGWHVVSLNSYLKQPEHDAQMAWLKADLAQSKARCTLAFWHHPLFSSGGHGNNAQMREAWRLLAAAGAELVLTAHDHDYERFAPQNADGRRDDLQGIQEFVVGTGGARLTPMGFRKSNSEASSNFTHGVLKLTLRRAGYEWEFLPTSPGELSDKGTATCH